MPEPQTTLLIEGSFKELVEELADFIDNLKKSPGDSELDTKSEVAPLLEKYSAIEAQIQSKESSDEEALDEARDNVLDSIVPSSSILNTSSDKDFIPSYNLLVHLIRQSDEVNKYLQSVCRSLSTDLPPSPTRYGLALTILTTIFNTTDPDDQIRYAIFMAIIDVISRSSNFDNLRPQLAYLDHWLSAWQAPAAKQRTMYMRIAQVAREAGESEESYSYLIRALRTFSSSEASGDTARATSVEALKSSLLSSTRYDFEDLTALDSIEALRDLEPIYFELLEIFIARGLEEYSKFKSEHGGWLEKQGFEDSILTRKIRLLTFASLASTGSAAQTRSLPYAVIAQGLQIDDADVEMWAIDAIRAGLVEGKLSQSSQTFLVHRSTHRVFTMSQWREVAGRLEMWKLSLTNVLGVIRQEKENLAVQKEQDAKAVESRVNGMNRSYASRIQREPIDTGID